MNEKQKEIADQYDITVEASYRNRGCLQLVTDQGLATMIPYNGSPLRLACEYELQKKLQEVSSCQVDEIIPNREGGFLSYDKYRTPFIMKRAFAGRECSLRDKEDIKKACQSLAKLHQAFARLPEELGENKKTPPIPQMFLSRTRELKRIRNYIRKSGRKTEFELAFTSCYGQFYAEAQEALRLAGEQGEAFWSRRFGLCHGSYHQHNVIIQGDQAAILNLGRFHYNQQLLDFYNFARKAMEKNQYLFQVMEGAMGAYGQILPLDGEDYLLLYLLFSFPEKFWKISNQYYNGKKCWMPQKNLEKLKKMIGQNEKRRQFIKNFREKYLGDC